MVSVCMGALPPALPAGSRAGREGGGVRAVDPGRAVMCVPVALAATGPMLTYSTLPTFSHSSCQVQSPAALLIFNQKQKRQLCLHEKENL